MKIAASVLLIAAMAFASQDVAPSQGIPQHTSNSVIPILDTIACETFSGAVYNVGLGTTATNVWFTCGHMQGGGTMNKIYVVTIATPHTLVATYDQNMTTGWGLRDLTSNGTYMFGSEDTYIDYYNMTTGVKVGSFIHTACNPNRALAYDGTYFYSGTFSANIYRITWDGVSGSTATSTIWSTAIANAGTYGAAYDSQWPCLWVSTASADGLLYQLNSTTGALIATFNLSPEVATAGGCEMGNYNGQSQLWILAQATPDNIYCLNVRSIALEHQTWGEIKSQF